MPLGRLTALLCCPHLPQVYIGGAVDEADRMVATGKAKVDDFKFMLHLCGWAPGQLEAEIARGVWLPVATSANVSPSPQQQKQRVNN